MNSLKVTTIVLALGFAAGMGCGSDSGKAPMRRSSAWNRRSSGDWRPWAWMPERAAVARTTGAGGTGGVIGMDGGGGS